MSLLDVVETSMIAVLALCWLVGVGSAFELVSKHRAEGRTVADYFRGQAWFGADAFAATGASARRRMHLALAGFFLLTLASLGLVFATEFVGT